MFSIALLALEMMLSWFAKCFQIPIYKVAFLYLRNPHYWLAHPSSFPVIKEYLRFILSWKSRFMSRQFLIKKDRKLAVFI